MSINTKAAEWLLERFNANEENIQEKILDGAEPYRTIMYTLYPGAAEIDGGPIYWEIVRRFEGLLNDRPPVEDWND